MFNIYYMNFQKAYEIKAMLSNVIAVGKNVENNYEKAVDAELQAKLGMKFLKLFNAEVGSNVKGSLTDTEKVLDSFQVVMTKSIILDEVMTRCKEINTFDTTVCEGDLIKINNVSLSLINESEIRAIKMLSDGILKGFKTPQTGDMDINNILTSVLKDSSYILKGTITNQSGLTMIKIPFTSDSEFESLYSIDDLFIGSVSIVGIYKGKIKGSKLTNTLESLQNHNNRTINDNDIHPSQEFVDNTDSDHDKATEYHYVDLIAIVQDIHANEPSSSSGNKRTKKN